MEVIKEFGDTIKVDGTRVNLMIRIKEVDKNGDEKIREDLLDKIEVFSKDNSLEIKDLGVSDGYNKIGLKPNVIQDEISRK